MTNPQSGSKPAFDLKGAAFTILVLSLRNSDMQTVAAQLAERVEQARDFFHHAPLVLDFRQLAEDRQADFDLAWLMDVVRDQGFMPVGMTGGAEELKRRADALDLAVLTARAGGMPRLTEPEPDKEPPRLEAAAYVPPLILTEPIRSGQSIVAAQGDLVVMASVSSGAEIKALGNIHIYGTLRGRAFAGNSGNAAARIFCQRLEAEFVSIAGAHAISEDFPVSLRSKAVQIQLHSGRLHIAAL